MKTLMKGILRGVYRGLVSALLLGLAGATVGYLWGTDMVRGASYGIFAGGTLVMAFAVGQLVGSPRKRMAFFIGGKLEKGGVSPLTEAGKREKDFTRSGFSEALIGVIIIVAGFLLDAMARME
jgi:hypothetical protein